MSTRIHIVLLVGLVSDAVAETLRLNPTRDSTMYAESGALGNGDGVGLFSGVTNAGTVRRALLQFDLSSVPAGSLIHDVELQLRITQTISSPQFVELYRVLSSWGEATTGASGAGGAGFPATSCDATWSHRFWPGATCSEVRWSNPGGDLTGLASALTSAGNLGTLVTFRGVALVADVRAFVDGSLPNHGWALRHTDEFTGQSAKRFGSREAPSAADRPTLVVTYTPPTSAFCLPAGANSVSAAGAAIDLDGSASLSSNDNALEATATPDTFGLFAQARSVAPTGLVLFDGTLCLAGSIDRFPVQVAVGGTARLGLDFAGQGPEAIVQAGETWYYQWFYRDTTPGGANLSAGIAVSWAP